MGRRSLGGTRIAGLMAGMLMLASCAAVGGRSLVSVESQRTLKAQELEISWAAAEPEVTPPEVAPLPNGQIAPVAKMLAARSKPGVPSEPWLSEEVPIFQHADVMPVTTLAKAAGVPVARPRPDVMPPEVAPVLTSEMSPAFWAPAPEAPVAQVTNLVKAPDVAVARPRLEVPAQLQPVPEAPVAQVANLVKAPDVPVARPRLEVPAQLQPVQEAPVAQVANLVKAPNVPAARPSPKVPAQQQLAQAAPVPRQAEEISLATPATAPAVPAGPIRLLDVELQDVGPTVARVLIKSDYPILDYKYYTLPKPPRLVIDVQKAIHAIPKRVRALAGGPIKKIRSSQYQVRPTQVTRVVLDLSSKLPYQIHETPGSLQILIGETEVKDNGKRGSTAVAPTARRPSALAARPIHKAPLPIHKTPPPPRKTPVLEKPQTLSGFNKRISVDLRQMNILDVMKFLAVQGGLNIVTGKNVGGRVTLSLKDVSIRDVHDIIALSYELAYVVQNGVVHLMTEADYKRLFGSSFADQRRVKTLQLRYADAANVAAVLGNIKSSVGRVIADVKTRTVVLIDVPEMLEKMAAAAEGMDQATELHTQVFELGYGNAEEVKAEVEKALTPDLGAVRFDKRTNTLIATDRISQMNEIRQVIKAFDRKTREVIIEAKIIQVRLDDQFQMGVNWEALFENLKDLRIKQTFPIVPPLASSLDLTLGTLADDGFTAVINLLQSVGTTNILSAPQIAVVENQEATILVGTREAFITSVVTQTQQAATTAEEITFIDVGVQLKVTPSINADGFVTMKIKPEVSSVTRTLTTAAGNAIPIVETSTAETTVMVQDGITILIGGLMKDELVETVKKIPVLGDVPYLGSLFRSRDEKVVKSELVIFLTPKIISGKDSVAGVASADRNRVNKEKEL